MPGWCEWWSFTAVEPDAIAGLVVRLAVHPERRRCTYWAGVARVGEPYLLVRDDDLDVPPRSQGLEVRGSLWATCHCEEPMDRWTLGLESWAVAFDEGCTTDAWSHERGHRTGLALDLSFEDDGGEDLPIEEGYSRWGRLWGEISTGAGNEVEVWEVEGWPAVRRHAWGPPRATGWSWAFDRIDGGFSVHEHSESLPRDTDGLPLTDGLLHATAHAPALATEPAGWRIGGAIGRSADGASVGWMESWYPPP